MSFTSVKDDETAEEFLMLLAQKTRPLIKRARLIFPMQDRIHKTNTGGYRIVIAATRSMRIELWYDMYARYPKRYLWYGYYWDSKKDFDIAFGHWRDYVRSTCIRRDSDATGAIPHHFKNPLRTSEFKHPLLEQYKSSDEYFFGRFDTRRSVSTRLINDIVRFLTNTVAHDGRIDIAQVFPLQAKALEGQEDQRLLKALRYARVHKVAAERKKRDRYICQICKFDFSKAYPGLGSDFAEAHHKVSLKRAGGARVRVTPRSFLTLCANCHRMMHRAETRFSGDPIKHVVQAFNRGKRANK